MVHFMSQALPIEMNRLHMVRAAAPSVISRGLRHVSLCFDRRSERPGRFLMANSASSPDITCASSYHFYSEVFLTGSLRAMPSAPTSGG
jgi:hypothetical protein